MLGSWRPAALPNLTDTICQIKSPFDRNYNCIAFAAGDPTKWWWPDEDGYWPQGVPRLLTFEAFVMAFSTLGFMPCANGDLEFGYEKIALYGRDRGDGHLIPTHAAIQLPDGRWTSKLGQCEDVEHDTLWAVNGPDYGAAVRFLMRMRGLRGFHEQTETYQG